MKRHKIVIMNPQFSGFHTGEHEDFDDVQTSEEGNDNEDGEEHLYED